MIGYLPAWRGVPAGVAAVLKAAKQASDAVIQAAEAATLAAAGTPGAPAAKAAEEATKATAAATMGAMVTSMAMGADIHACTTPLPIPPHGPGVVIDGSPTVLINNLPACRLGDTILEPVGPPNKIVKGEFTVIIGNSGSGCSISGSSSSGAGVQNTPPATDGQAKYQPASGGAMSGPSPIPVTPIPMPKLPSVPGSGPSAYAASMSEAKQQCAAFG